MPKQLLNSWKGQRRAIQSVSSRIKECFGKCMTQIVGTKWRGKFCSLTQFGNNLPNTAFRQRPTLTQKEMPIWPAAPGSNGFSPNGCSLTPLFRQMFAIGEIRIERVACFLDQRDLAMLESFASANNEQPAPCGDLRVGDLESCNLRDTRTCIAKEGCQSKG